MKKFPFSSPKYNKVYFCKNLYLGINKEWIDVVKTHTTSKNNKHG